MDDDKDDDDDGGVDEDGGDVGGGGDAGEGNDGNGVEVGDGGSGDEDDGGGDGNEDEFVQGCVAGGGVFGVVMELSFASTLSFTPSSFTASSSFSSCFARGATGAAGVGGFCAMVIDWLEEWMWWA